jgi:hypothetical protein
MVMTDPITDPLGLDRPEREDDRLEAFPVPPFGQPPMTFAQTIAAFQELAAKAELDRLKTLRDRMVNKA